MSEPKNTSEILLARLAEGLDATAKMTNALLSDLRESEADFASMKTELNILKENVKGLSELVRDGGTSSILTRVALIEQNIETINKWIDSHVDVHQRVKQQFSDVKNQLSQIEKRLSDVEKIVQSIQEEAQEQERERRSSYAREMDLAHEKKKSDVLLRAERQSAMVKIIAAVVIGILGLVVGYLANSWVVAKKSNNPEAPAKVIPRSSGSSAAP